MTKQCCICGCEFEPHRKNQIVCPDEDCRRAYRLEYLRRYNKERREHQRKAVNEYNRKWMADYRARKKAEEVEQIEGVFPADGYAERQKQRTLELIGRVQI